MANVLFETLSKSGKRVRLTASIWRKVQARHPEFQSGDYLSEIRSAIERPAYVVGGWTNELLALYWCTMAPSAPKYLCVVYRELNGEGFIITAFFISKHERLLRRGVIWQQG